jgi:hypothetical protein
VTSKRGRGPEWRDQRTKRQLDVLMKTELEMMVSSKKKTVIITHKGEIEVEESDKGLEGPMERIATSIEEIHKRHVAVVSTNRKKFRKSHHGLRSLSLKIVKKFSKLKYQLLV